MIKLTRLNRSIVAINPDHISWVDVVPDTTICLIGGEKIIVRETLDRLIDEVIAFRQAVAAGAGTTSGAIGAIGATVQTARVSTLPGRTSSPSFSRISSSGRPSRGSDEEEE
jgi:flagellar protein FlbD